MFLNNKPTTENDIRKVFTELGELDTIELVCVDCHGNFYFKVNTFKPFVKFT
jgi:formate-dependent nitrite reductase cytochrome c552 subunit